MSKEAVSTYAGEAIQIRYDRRRCIHAAECGRGSGLLFDPSHDPWCDPDAVTAEEAVAIVERCPSGALTWEPADGAGGEATADRNTVHVNPHGPLYLRGDVVLKRGDGSVIAREKRVALCRCGQSAIKPWCDGSHTKAAFRDAGPIASDPGGAADEGGPVTVTVRPDGPYLLAGSFVVHAGSGRPAVDTKCALCRCGSSGNKPFCDGSHTREGFKAE